MNQEMGDIEYFILYIAIKNLKMKQFFTTPGWWLSAIVFPVIVFFLLKGLDALLPYVSKKYRSWRFRRRFRKGREIIRMVWKIKINPNLLSYYTHRCQYDLILGISFVAFYFIVGPILSALLIFVFKDIESNIYIFILGLLFIIVFTGSFFIQGLKILSNYSYYTVIERYKYLVESKLY